MRFHQLIKLLEMSPKCDKVNQYNRAMKVLRVKPHSDGLILHTDHETLLFLAEY